MLEQAAHCLLRTAPPHVRKYAFHMVLSGLRYNACGQQQLGIRAYRCAPHARALNMRTLENHLSRKD